MSLSFLIFVASPQTKDEWFRQKETKRKYMVQQIAALKLYLGYVEKGYRIAQRGLEVIHSIKKGDFQLHQEFFHSLGLVNPSIAKWSHLAEISIIQMKILAEVKQGLADLRESKNITVEEGAYCTAVLEKMLQESLQLLDAVLLVTSPGELHMTDAERLQRIESVFMEMRELLGDVVSFYSEIKLLAAYRQQEIRDSKN